MASQEPRDQQERTDPLVPMVTWVHRVLMDHQYVRIEQHEGFQ